MRIKQFRVFLLFADKFEKTLEPVLEDRIEELRHRLRIELAVYEGAKNVIRSFQNAKSADKKTLHEVSARKTPKFARIS